MLNEHHRAVHRITGTVFAIIALLHLFRVIYQVPVQAGMWMAPMWLSWIVVIVGGALAIILWRSS